MAGDANNTGDRVDRGVSGYSANRGTGTGATTNSATTKRLPAKVRPNPAKEDDSSSSEDDDPVIAAITEDLMRWAPRGPPARPVYTRPKGTPSDAPKSGTAPLSDKKSTAAAPSQKPAVPRTR